MCLAMNAFTGYVFLLLLDYSTSASNRRCFPLYEGGSLCFTQPDPPVALSWPDAQQWCSNIGATLPMPQTYYQIIYGNAVGYFGLSPLTLWLGANSTLDLNDWYWANGTRFTGTIDHGNNTRKTHAYIIRNGTDIKLVTGSPLTEYANCICKSPSSDELGCARTWNSFWTSGKCYTKSKHLGTWSNYVSNCGGIKNLATLDNLAEISRWIDDRTKFWIGLRCSWWSWQDIVSGRSFEVTDYRFGLNLPNNTSPECLASYVHTNGHFYWMNRNCFTDLQFICQQYVNATTTTRTTTTTTTTRPISTTPKTSPIHTTVTNAAIPNARKSATSPPPSSASTEPLRTGLSSNMPTMIRTSELAGMPSIKTTAFPSSIHEVSSEKYGLPIGLCGGLLLAILVWLAILSARVYKNYRSSPKNLQKQCAGTVQLTYSNPYEISPWDDSSDVKERAPDATQGPEKPPKEEQV